MANRDLVVRFIGDDRSLNQAFARSGRSAKAFQGQIATTGASVSRAFGAAGIALGASAFVAATQRAVLAASDLEEQFSKNEQVFGSSAAAIRAWSETTSTALGISQREALAAVGTFGNLFRVIDLAPEQAREMSQALVQLAADLASFNNASPEDVLVALRSGLIGEAEPLRRYGVLLSEAKVQQLALANTGKTNVKTLTDQEKTLARYQIILRDTAIAQGDFARTSDGMANQTRILRAELSNLSASLGGTLLPFFTSLTRGTNDAIGVLNSVGDAIDNLGGANFSAANAQLEQLIGRFDELSRLNASFAAPELEKLGPQIREISIELERLGATERVIAGFREASAAIDQALRDGVITPLEAAQLETEELGRLFLTVVPENVLTGLGAGVRSSLEDATAAARVGVEDLGSEIRSGIEDASRDAVTAARAGGEATGNAFAEGLQAAAGRIQGQLQGLTEGILRAQIAGNQGAELAGLQQQEAALRRQLRVQEKIRAAGGSGAPTAQRKIRQDILPDLRANKQQQEAILADQERVARDAASSQQRVEKSETDRANSAERTAQQRQRSALAARKGNQFEALGLTSEGGQRTPGAGALRQRLGNLQKQIKGTVLDTEKTRSQLANIAKVLSGAFGKVGKDVRLAILQMLNDIADALAGKGAKSSTAGGERFGEITRGGIRSSQFLTRGLDLTDEERRIIQQRNLGRTGRRGLSAFGFGLDGQSSTVGFGGADRIGNGNVIINGGVTIVSNDPNDMMKKLQKKGRRSSGGRRGRHGGANLGLQ